METLEILVEKHKSDVMTSGEMFRFGHYECLQILQSGEKTVLTLSENWANGLHTPILYIYYWCPMLNNRRAVNGKA